jgi:hypothetical protein
MNTKKILKECIKEAIASSPKDKRNVAMYKNIDKEIKKKYNIFFKNNKNRNDKR